MPKLEGCNTFPRTRGAGSLRSCRAGGGGTLGYSRRGLPQKGGNTPCGSSLPLSVRTRFLRHLSDQHSTPTADRPRIPWHSGFPPGAPAYVSLRVWLGRARVGKGLKLHFPPRDLGAPPAPLSSVAGNFANLPQRREGRRTTAEPCPRRLNKERNRL